MHLSLMPEVSVVIFSLLHFLTAKHSSTIKKNPKQQTKNPQTNPPLFPWTIPKKERS